MRLGEKLKHLRYVEGIHRGMDRAMTKAEVVRAMKQELGDALSHPYLCQLEGGARVHMTASTRELLARFFKVLPGYLVDDLEGYQTSLQTEIPSGTDRLKSWFSNQAEELREEPYLAHVLFKLSRVSDPMHFVMMVDQLIELPPPALERVAEAIRQEAARD